MQLFYITFHAIDQLMIRRPKIRARRLRCVVAGACVRWPRMEISGRRKCLPEQLRADDLAVLLDQTSVRLRREKKLSESRYRERVD